MNPLTIELIQGQRREFDFLGWKRDCSAIYATTSDGRPTIIVPISAYPADCRSGKPYRFPPVTPLRIIPVRLDLAWTPLHYDVLRRWREVELHNVDALSEKDLFVCDALKSPQPTRSPQECDRARERMKGGIEWHYKTLVETPLCELLTNPAYYGALHHFSEGRWATEIGEDYRVMLSEAAKFEFSYRRAYGARSQETDCPGAFSAMSRVRFLMSGQSGERFHLFGVEERHPTDTEARGYALMRRLAGKTSGRLESPAAVTADAEQMKLAVERIEEVTKRGAGRLTAAGDHVEAKAVAAVQTLRQVQKELQPILDDLETNHARLEAVTAEHKLKESPRQTRGALAANRVPKPLIDLIMSHLLVGKPIPKAPTAARTLQCKFSSRDGFDRRTVHRHYKVALPILRAAGWPERLLPSSQSPRAANRDKPNSTFHEEEAEGQAVTPDSVVKAEDGGLPTPFECLLQQEQGSEEES